MKRIIVGAIAFVAVGGSLGMAAARGQFDSGSLKGRYSGNSTIAFTIAVDTDQSINIEARQLLALTFDGKSGVSGVTSVTSYVPGVQQNLFTCAFNATGTYEIGDEGLGKASLDLVPSVEGCAGPVTLKMSLLVGGHNRSRLDFTIDGATPGTPDDPPLALVGSGVLVER